MKIVQIDYGAGNVKNIQFAFERFGFSPILSSDPDEIMGADKVIFPGVGEASSAMKKLRHSGLDRVIPNLTQPVLGICLGMQLLCDISEENNTRGLAIFNQQVKRFSNAVKVPQIGWNSIHELRSHLFDGVRENEFMYLLHSYYVPLCEETIAVSDYEIPYSAAIQKNNFYGVQFHPEKSSVAGELILKNFLAL
ncbi:MAG: imidazole glycerol phosphate synthase subunit HisH [Bacteroidia bacterium]|nr:imidazole glycerol phosphate synthase subunit HisH [Bacteroidia bacterium]NNF30013.1 imidazole glycerol phosphate synthase subunit HisH [Flavobacteriaceae bacterium]MBT8274744.1 imidazole glycerol phosphate synthase subunit HisH [Bacteroidia bacterium]NNJ81496.1 imidazole glycerol phosphate synthase subunit HisH [Flavobacteriaceae bacterium]NNK53718.1 imidazole glycerol phosphate synthase subunit HisH [Flavobacteriaceae bacterium]